MDASSGPYSANSKPPEHSQSGLPEGVLLGEDGVDKPSLPLRKRRKRNKKAAFSLLQVRISTSVTSKLDLRQAIRFEETQPTLFGVGSGTDPTAERSWNVHPPSPGERLGSKSEQRRERDDFSFFQCHRGLESQHPRLCLYIWCRSKQGGGN